jgi:hypothetical protein
MNTAAIATRIRQTSDILNLALRTRCSSSDHAALPHGDRLEQRLADDHLAVVFFLGSWAVRIGIVARLEPVLDGGLEPTR